MPDGRFQLDPQRPLDIAAALVAINSVNPCLCSHAPGEAEVQAEMDELLARLARRDLNFRGSARVFLHRSGAELPADAPIAACLGRHLAARTGRTPEPAGMSPWLEAGMLCEAGTPTVLFGPAGEAPHAAVEYVQIESLPVCAQVLVDTAREFCGERETEGPAVRGERSEQAAKQRSGE